MKNKSLQSRIAIRIIVSVVILITVLCAIILITFKIHAGQLDTAHISLKDVEHLFLILLRVCLIGCFFTFILLYFISRKIAENSTKPVRKIINIANTITHNNLSARIPLPGHKDELYELSETINNLLDRIENALEREKSFTSYASHEFRTPLSVLKGTMEVLIRRPRSEAEYRERIQRCIKEVDKLNEMVEQLLFLTRYEESKQTLTYKEIPLLTLVSECLTPYCDTLVENKIECKLSISPENSSIYTDENSFSTILKNLISNAIKYANQGGKIEIKGYRQENKYIIEIINTGKGVPLEELKQIFEKFYRSYSFGQSHINGFGLGLAIVKRFCELLDIDIQITSEIDKQTIARLIIPQKADQIF